MKFRALIAFMLISIIARRVDCGSRLIVSPSMSFRTSTPSSDAIDISQKSKFRHARSSESLIVRASPHDAGASTSSAGPSPNLPTTNPPPSSSSYRAHASDIVSHRGKQGEQQQQQQLSTPPLISPLVGGMSRRISSNSLFPSTFDILQEIETDSESDHDDKISNSPSKSLLSLDEDLRTSSTMYDRSLYIHRQELEQVDKMRTLVRNSFYETFYDTPIYEDEIDLFADISLPNGTSRTVKVDQQQTASLMEIAKMQMDLHLLNQVLDEFSKELMHNNPDHWHRALAFKNLLTQFLFYHSLFSNPALGKVFAGIDSYSFQLILPSVKILVLSAAFMQKIHEDIQLALAGSAAMTRNPVIKFVAELMVSKKAIPTEEEVFKITSAAASAPSQFNLMQQANVPGRLRNMKVFVEGSDILSSIDDIISHPNGALDVAFDFTNGAGAVLTIADRFIRPLGKIIRKHKLSVFNTGAILTLACTKIALNPSLLTHEQSLTLTVVVKAMELLEEYQKTRLNGTQTQNAEAPVEKTPFNNRSMELSVEEPEDDVAKKSPTT